MKLNNGLNLDALGSNTDILGISDTRTICGVIPFDKGFVIFVHESASNNYIEVQHTSGSTNGGDEAGTTTRYRGLNLGTQIVFKKTQPVRGTTTYNQKGQLIVLFSCGVDGDWEDKIINIDNEDYDYNNNGTYTLTSSDVYKLDLTPNVQFPTISCTRFQQGGSLPAATYQIAVSYNIYGDYTNYSLLSMPEAVYDSSTVSTSEHPQTLNWGSLPGEITTMSLKFSLDNLDSIYDKFKIAIIQSGETVTKVYSTNDLVIKKVNGTAQTYEFILATLIYYNEININDVLINSMFYSNSETISIMNNRVYKANLKTNTNARVDEFARLVAGNVMLGYENKPILLDGVAIPAISSSKKHNPGLLRSTQNICFQRGEVYALYLTLLDKKGNVIGSYPINSTTLFNIYSWLDQQLTIINTINLDGTQYCCYRIPIKADNEAVITDLFVQLQVTLQLQESWFTTYSDVISNIGGWCVHRAERNISNSRVHCQGVVINNPIQKIVDNKLFIVQPEEVVLGRKMDLSYISDIESYYNCRHVGFISVTEDVYFEDDYITIYSIIHKSETQHYPKYIHTTNPNKEYSNSNNSNYTLYWDTPGTTFDHHIPFGIDNSFVPIVGLSPAFLYRQHVVAGGSRRAIYNLFQINYRDDGYSHRFYSFEDLFNKNNILGTKLQLL